MPLTTVVSISSSSDLPVARAYNKRGKDKVPEVEETTLTKKPRRAESPDHTPIIDALLSGGDQLAALMDKLIAFLPEAESTRYWLTNRVSKHETHELLQRARSAEQKVEATAELKKKVKRSSRDPRRPLQTTKPPHPLSRTLRLIPSDWPGKVFKS
nr:uncharacterized protein LOC109173786 [Ipomoea batatas]